MSKVQTATPKVPTKFTWFVSFRMKWTAMLVNDLWPVRCPNVPLVVNFTSEQWQSLFDVFKVDFEAKHKITIRKTCSKKPQAMKEVLAKFHTFFDDKKFVEKLFKQTKDLLANVPAQQRLNAVQNEHDFLEKKKTSSLQATAVNTFNQLVNQNTYGQNNSAINQVADDSLDPLLKNIDLLENCVEMPEQSALQQFEMLVQQKQLNGMEPEQALDLYTQHLQELQADLKEKMEATKLLTENWKKRKSTLQQVTPVMTGMPAFQQPVVPLADVMQFMFQFMAQQSQFVQQYQTPAPVTTPVPPSPQAKPVNKQASTSRPWTNDPQWQDTSAMDEDGDEEDDEATEDSDE